MAIRRVVYFEYSGGTTIPLTADITTDAINVTDISGGWVIQPVDVTGLDGAPTWSLLYSLDGTTYLEYDTSNTSALATDVGVSKLVLEPVVFFKIAIKMNGNTTGSMGFLLTSR